VNNFRLCDSFVERTNTLSEGTVVDPVNECKKKIVGLCN